MNIQKYRIVLPFFLLAILHSGSVLAQQGENSSEGTRSELEEKTRIILNLTSEKEAMQGVLEKLRADKERLEKEVHDLLFGNFQSSAKKTIELQLEKVREPYEEQISTMNKIVSSYKIEHQEREEEISLLMKMNEGLERQLLLAGVGEGGFGESIGEPTLDFSSLKGISRKEKAELKKPISDQIDEMRVPLEKRIDVLRQRIKANERNNNTQREKLEKENGRLNEKMKSCKIKLQDEELAMADKKAEIEKLSEEKDQYRRENDANKLILKRREDQLERLNREITFDKKKLRDNKMTLTNQELLVGRLNDKIEVYKGQIKESEKLVKEKEAYANDLREQREAFQGEIPVLRQERLFLEEKYEALRKKHDEVEKSLTKKIRIQEKRIVEVEKQGNIKETYVVNLREQYRILQDETFKLNREKSSLEKEHKELLKEHEKIKHSLTTKIKAKEGRVAKVEQQNSDKEAHIVDLRAQHKVLQKEISILRRDKSSLVDKYEALFKEHDEIKENLTAKVRIQKKRAGEAEKQSSDRKARTVKLLAQYEALHEEASVLRRDKSSLGEKYEALLEKYDKVKGDLAATIKTLGKIATKNKKQSRNKTAYLKLLKEEVQNALDLLSY